MHVCIDVRMCVCFHVCLYVCMHACLYMYVYVYYTHTPYLLKIYPMLRYSASGCPPPRIPAGTGPKLILYPPIDRDRDRPGPTLSRDPPSDPGRDRPKTSDVQREMARSVSFWSLFLVCIGLFLNWFLICSYWSLPPGPGVGTNKKPIKTTTKTKHETNTTPITKQYRPIEGVCLLAPRIRAVTGSKLPMFERFIDWIGICFLFYKNK